MDATEALIGTMEPSSPFLSLPKEQWRLLLLVLVASLWPEKSASGEGEGVGVGSGAIVARVLAAHGRLHTKEDTDAPLVALDAAEVGSLVRLLRSV